MTDEKKDKKEEEVAASPAETEMIIAITPEVASANTTDSNSPEAAQLPVVSKESEVIAPVIQENTVLVGFTGKIDSMVAAYLLKKQGIKVVAVTINFYNPEEPDFARKPTRNQFDYDYDMSEVNDTSFIAKLSPHCQVPDMMAVKALADQLEITHYAVNAYEEFREMVISRSVSAALEGNYFLPCIRCHKTIIKILKEKAALLGITHIATGHYAKIQYSAKDNSYYLGSSIDAEYNQSKFLSELSQSEMSSLILPLASMRRSEVQKIVKSMGWKATGETKGTISERPICFRDTTNMPKLVERLSPPQLRKPGQLMRYEDDYVVQEHKGIFNFYVGQTIQDPSIHKTDGEQEVVKIFASGSTVFIGPSAKLNYKGIFLGRIMTKGKIDRTKPIPVFYEVDLEHQRTPCLMHFKSLSCVYLELETEHQGQLPIGHQVFVFDRKEVRGSKLLLKGEVHYYEEFGPISKLNRFNMNEEPTDEEIEYAKAKAAKEQKEIKF